MDFNGLRKFWIAYRQHRELFQLSGKEKEPQTSEGQRRSEIPDGRQSGRREFRPRVPEKIDQTHENQPNGYATQEGWVALQIARKQQEERDKKVEDDNNYRDHSPLAVQARVIQSDLLRLIAGPDDQQLRKLEVSPKHHEGQQQLAQIMNVARLKNAGKGAGASEQHHNGNHQRHRRNKLADHEQEAVNGGRPVRRERHHPIDGGEGHNKNIDDDARAGQHLEPAVHGVVLWEERLARRCTDTSFQRIWARKARRLPLERAWRTPAGAESRCPNRRRSDAATSIGRANRAKAPK